MGSIGSRKASEPGTFRWMNGHEVVKNIAQWHLNIEVDAKNTYLVVSDDRGSPYVCFFGCLRNFGLPSTAISVSVCL
ncbi:hypothetical protein L596_007564 [Steinernema carpocapsae]|uniref:Uncharacterized protein n=1 Tax=Steinernema carpocapsae TaxID=34508 RepID=A0A4U5PAC1_STECR|nr:hypothetical protein L596_007564 [Steinernema carpocapsae]